MDQLTRPLHASAAALYLRVTDALERLRVKLLPGGEYEPREKLTRIDGAIALAAALAAAVIALCGPLAFDRHAYVNSLGGYFASDPDRVLASMTDRYSFHHHRVSVHPIFSLVVFPAVRFLGLFGLTPLASATLLCALCAAGSAGLFFLALRSLTLPRGAAAAFTAAFIASAAFVHWFSFPETYSYSAFSIVLMVFILAWAPAQRWLIWAAGSAATLAMLTSNWMFGLVAAFCRLSVRNFIRANAAALALIVVLSLVQAAIFPHAKLFFLPNVFHSVYKNETEISMAAAGYRHWTPAENVRSTLLYSAVAPEPRVEKAMEAWGLQEWTNNTYAPLTSFSLPGVAAMLCWVVLLLNGVWGCWRARALWRVAFVLLAGVALQTALYAVYGEIPFLYSANIIPLLMAVAAFGWFTPLRYASLAAAIAFTVFGGINNYTQFRTAARLDGEIAARSSHLADIVTIPGINAPFPKPRD